MIPVRSDVHTYQKYADTNETMVIKGVKKDDEKKVSTEDKRKVADEWKEKGNSFVKLKDYESAS